MTIEMTQCTAQFAGNFLRLASSKTILSTKFFEAIFDETKDSILNEYLDLKVCIAHYKTTCMSIYEAIIC